MAFATTASSQDGRGTVVDFFDSWEWLHAADGIDPALSSGDADFHSTWFAPIGYDGPAFNSTGQGVFAYGTINWIRDEPCVHLGQDIGTATRDGVTTAYFRKNFSVDEAITELRLELLADDAAVIYIDGAEVFRTDNLVGPDTYDNAATASGDEIPVEFLLDFSLEPLAVGDHVIAVSVHNSATNLSDLGFDLRLTIPGFPGSDVLRVDRSVVGGSGNGATWADAIPSLHRALFLARPGSSIWVRAGVYIPDEPEAPDGCVGLTSFNLKSGVAILGGFAGDETEPSQRDPMANPTILSGDSGRDDRDEDGNSIAESTADIVGDNLPHVVICIDADSETALDGFAVTGGDALGNLSSSYRQGGGIRIDSGDPAIRNCLLSGNRAWRGGGIYYRSPSQAIENCSFMGNWAEDGAGLYVEHPYATELIRCRFVSNVSESLGAAVFGFKRLEDCVVHANYSERGGAVVAASTEPSAVNCVFSGNAAASTSVNSRGSAIAAGEELSMVNCTVAGNTGNAISHSRALALRNCVFWGNGRVGLSLVGAPNSIDYCLIEGLTGSFGEGNLDGTDPANAPRFLQPVDPAFAGIPHGDLRLATGSPAIDAGDSAGISLLNDLAGNPRIVGASVDIGAYEGGHAPLPQLADSDDDGLGDLFELAHTDPPSTTALDPASNADGDSFTAIEEFAFGLDPDVPDRTLQPVFGETGIRYRTISLRVDPAAIPFLEIYPEQAKALSGEWRPCLPDVESIAPGFLTRRSENRLGFGSVDREYFRYRVEPKD